MIEVFEVQEATCESYSIVCHLLNQLTENNHLTYAKFQEIIKSDSSFLLFIKVGDSFVGMTTVTCYRALSGIKGWVEDVVIDNEYRGKGYSVKLLEHAIVFARNKGIEKLMLTSRPSRLVANNLYRKLGFTQRETNVYVMNL
ncbi:MAG: GNAT family N-acetyltransferase [Bacteroidales bacterium]